MTLAVDTNLDGISVFIDALCADDSNFDDDGNLSIAAQNELAGILKKAVASFCVDALLTHLTARIQAWRDAGNTGPGSMTSVSRKIVKGARPRLSRQEVTALIYCHIDSTGVLDLPDGVL
jgi:hypothetical protein